VAGVPTATAAAAAAGAAGAAAAGAAVIGMMWDDVVLATMPAATTVSGVAVRLERLCVTNASSSSPTPAGVDGVNGGGGGGGGGGDGVRVEGARGVLYADSCAFSGSPRQGVKWRDICATASCPTTAVAAWGRTDRACVWSCACVGCACAATIWQDCLPWAAHGFTARRRRQRCVQPWRQRARREQQWKSSGAWSP
jgi:hypothetical protein